MAAADYRLCDICGTKAFYDSNLNYEFGPDEHTYTTPYRVGGKEQYPTATEEQKDKWGMRLDDVGDWAVICTDCAKTHRTAILPIMPTIID